MFNPTNKTNLVFSTDNIGVLIKIKKKLPVLPKKAALTYSSYFRLLHCFDASKTKVYFFSEEGIYLAFGDIVRGKLFFESASYNNQIKSRLKDSIILFFIVLVNTYKRLLPIHSNILIAAQKEKVLLIVGHSNSGKTTLSKALVFNLDIFEGWFEDAGYIDIYSSKKEIYIFSRVTSRKKIKNKFFQRCLAPTLDNDYKNIKEKIKNIPDSVEEHLLKKVGGIFFVSKSIKKETYSKKLEEKKSLELLISNAYFRKEADDLLAKKLFRLSQFIKKMPCYQVYLGLDAKQGKPKSVIKNLIPIIQQIYY